MTPPTHLPPVARGECPECHRRRTLRRDGSLLVMRRHHGRDTVICEGTGETPVPGILTAGAEEASEAPG